ncbi:hypothetical protein XENOCAPTIV_022301 [Xenoophorus captivus]|uniref:Uncharacterized protein n=1 Tax=Xenoophorus captivus TaxID=1517983 RepID=A0ABV0SDV3_9TELE
MFTARRKKKKVLYVCMYSTLPESPYPGLSLSDLQLPAASAAVVVGQVAHAYDDADDDVDDEGCFYVHSVIQTPVLDDRWDENVLTHNHVSYFSFTQTQRNRK